MEYNVLANIKNRGLDLHINQFQKVHECKSFNNNLHWMSNNISFFFYIGFHIFYFFIKPFLFSYFCTGARFSFTTSWVNGEGVNHNVYYSIGNSIMMCTFNFILNSFPQVYITYVLSFLNGYESTIETDNKLF